MMRVLHIHSGNLYGGTESALATLARRRDVCPEMEPYFAICFHGRLTEQLKTFGGRFETLGAVRVRRPWTVWKARRSLAELLRRERFDYAVCHSAWSQALFGPIVRSAGLPLALWLHDAATGKHWVERWARLTRPDRMICNSRFTAGTAAYLYPKMPTEVLYCPTEVPLSAPLAEELRAFRREAATPEDAVAVLQISRLERWKGHVEHLEALSRLRDLPGWICWQVGGPQRSSEALYYEELKNTAVHLGIADRVRFLGWRSNAPLILAAADIFCQPNTTPEPFGLVFMEALANRLPVIASADGGVAEIADSSCGILVPPGDVNALTNALRTLIQDRDLRNRLGASGPAKVKEFCDVGVQINRLHSLLAQTVRACQVIL